MFFLSLKKYGGICGGVSESSDMVFSSPNGPKIDPVVAQCNEKTWRLHSPWKLSFNICTLFQKQKLGEGPNLALGTITSYGLALKIWNPDCFKIYDFGFNCIRDSYNFAHLRRPAWKTAIFQRSDSFNKQHGLRRGPKWEIMPNQIWVRLGYRGVDGL